MRLINFCESPKSMNRFNNQWSDVASWIEGHGLDGVEMIFYDINNAESVPEGIVKGVHMMYWPDWVDFAHGNHAYLENCIGDQKRIEGLYSARNFDEFIENYRKEYEKICQLGASYCVFHVGSMRNHEAYTKKFAYSDQDVFRNVLHLIAKAIPEDNPVPIYFENLWGPGLNLKDSEATKAFIEAVPLQRKGIMLDLSHLLITNEAFTSYEGANRFIHERLDALGEGIKWIKGMHVNATFPNKYWGSASMDASHNDYKCAIDALDKYRIISRHIQEIDQHIPYESDALQSFIDRIDPEVVVYEVLADSKDQLNDYLVRQMKYSK